MTELTPQEQVHLLRRHSINLGIPTHDTFNRVFAALDPVQFQACFLRWMEVVRIVLPAEVIALD